jgi:hypothetical protein
MAETRVIITAVARQAIEEFERLRASASGSLQNVGASGAQLSDALNGIAQRAVGVVATVVSLDAALGAMNNAINDLAALDDLTQKTGASVETLSRLQQVAQTFGEDFSTVDSAVTKLAKGMAAADDDSNKVHKALKALGISAKDAAGALRDPAEVFIDVAKGLQKYEDGAAKAALMNDALGKSGADMLPFLNDTAGSVDQFRARTQEAVDQAARFQDQTGALRARMMGLATDITTAALPAMNDLLGAVIATSKGADGLIDKDVSGWADDLGIGLARVVDVAKLIPRLLSTVAGSFKAVAADVQFANTLLEYANPVGAIKARLNGTTATAEIAEALATRNKTVEEANQKLSDLWNIPANETEQAFLKRVAERGSAKGDAPKPTPKTLNYTTGNTTKQKSDYDSLNKSARDRLALIQGEISAGRELSQAEQEIAKIQTGRIAGTVKLTDAQANEIIGILQQTDVLQKSHKAEKDAANWIAQSTLARQASSTALAVEYQMYGQTDDARQVAMVAVKAEGDLQKYLADQRKAGMSLTDATIAQLRAETDERIKAEQATLAQSKALGYAQQLADLNARSAAESIADPKARGQALLDIDADTWRQRIELAGTGTAAQKVLQSEYNTWYANQQKQLTANVDVTRANEVLNIMQAIDEAAQSAAAGMESSFGRVGKAIGALTTTLSGYERTQAAIAAQLAAATKDSGGDQSKIFKANANAAQQSAEAQVKSYGDMAGAAKGFFSESSTGYKVLEGVEKSYRAVEMAMALESMAKKIFFKEGEVAANVALNATKISGEAAASAASTGLAATEASAWGVTAVVKAIASMPFPMNLVAGAATLAAVLAIGANILGSIGGGGGGGGQTAAEVQKAQGTGSVLGDADAKSESIANSLELLEENSGDLIPINKEMLTALRSIDAAMSGLTNLVVQVPGLVDGENLGIATGVLSKSLGGIWGKTKQTIIDSGLQYGGSVRDLQQGVGYNQYASVDTTKSSWFGLSKSTSNKIETAALNDELASQFALIFTGVDNALLAAADSLGVGADHVTAVLDGLSIDMTKVSLKDLSGDELTEALNAVISKTMDDMAEAVFPELDAFRQIGEGYAETVVRVASDYARLDAALTSTGDTFGAVGLASLTARERLITLVGGIDQLEEYASSFAENYLTEAERLAPVQKYVAEQLAGMGLAGVTTRDQFRDVVLGLDKTTEAGAEQFAALMALESAFAAVTPAMNEAASAADILADRVKLDGAIYDMTHTAAEALARQRAEELAAMDESLRSRQEQIYALQDEQAARELSASGRQMDIQIMGLQGDAAGALAAQRADELAALDAALRPQQERIYALQDEKSALDSVKAAASTLLSEVDSAFSVLQRVVDRERTAATAAYNVQMKSIQASIDGTTAKITKLQSLSQALSSALDQMQEPSDQAASSRASAQAQIQAALAIAKVGGALPDADAIKDALSTVTKDASGQFATYTDYLRDFYTTANDVASLGKLTDSALSVEEQTLEALNDQKDEATAAHEAEIARLDGILSAAQLQVDALKGVDVTLLSLSQAITGLGTAIASAQQNPVVGATSAISQAYQTSLGRAPDAAGLEYWQDQAANGSSTGSIVTAITNSAEAQLQGLYTSLLGRTADGGGMAYWMDQLEDGLSIADVRQQFLSSDEYKGLKVPGFATGGDFAGGLRLVGENGPELEVTGPSRIVNNNQTAQLLRGNSEEVMQENRALRQEMAEMRAMMESHLYAIAKNTRTVADIEETREVIGQPKVRADGVVA